MHSIELTIEYLNLFVEQPLRSYFEILTMLLLTSGRYRSQFTNSESIQKGLEQPGIPLTDK